MNFFFALDSFCNVFLQDYGFCLELLFLKFVSKIYCDFYLSVRFIVILICQSGFHSVEVKLLACWFLSLSICIGLHFDARYYS